MEAYQGIPPRLRISQRLDIRLILVVGIGLAVFSIIAGLLTYRYAYREQLEQADSLLRQFVQTVQVQAEIAAFVGNREIGRGVLEGLQTTSLIRAVRIEAYDGFSQVLEAFASEDFSRGKMYPLFSPMDKGVQIGWLMVVRNDGHIEAAARQVALFQTSMMLFQMLAAALMLGIVLRIWLINPIVRLSQSMAQIRPGSRTRLATDPKHVGDEIDLLTRGANAILAAAELAIGDLYEAKQSLEKALAALEEKEKIKSKFFAAASHDLRQPIHAIHLFLGTLKNTPLDDEQLKRVASIEAASRTLNELLESLLDISKLDAGVVVPQPELLGIEELFTRIDNNFSPLALQAKLRFKLFFPKRTWALLTDKRLLNVVLDNLIGNAFKSTAEGGILVALRVRAGACLIQVWDTGIGMEQEFLERIYDEFYQIDNPSRDRKKGLGLGLSIARRVSVLLGYELNCRSRRGKGTVFELRIPLADLREIARPLQSLLHHDVVDVADFRGKRLVILEDDETVGRGLHDWLLSCGIDAIVFVSAEQALGDAAVQSADGFIVDYQLAGAMDGLSFLDALQETAAQPVRAVLLSGNTSGSFIAAAARSRWPLLFKPAEPLQILAKLRPPMPDQG